MGWHLATLDAEKHQRINALERDLGVILVAWDQSAEGREGLSARQRDDAGLTGATTADPDRLASGPEIQAALNETYRSLGE